MKLTFGSYVCNNLEDFDIGIFDRVFGVVWYWFSKYGISAKIEDNKEANFPHTNGTMNQPV